MAAATVLPIKIMIRTNIPGQEIVPFTKALLYHPDFPGLANKPNYSEYPLISDNIRMPDSIVNELQNQKNYEKITNFFFNKSEFTSRHEGFKSTATAGSTASSTASTCSIDDKTNGILNYNVMKMLEFLFPTALPVNKNIKESFNTYIGPDIFGGRLKLSLEPVMAWFNFYNFSFIKVKDKEYTINRVIWLNDVLNHPIYSKLIDEYQTYKKWSEFAKTKYDVEITKIYNDMKQIIIKAETTMVPTPPISIIQKAILDVSNIDTTKYSRTSSQAYANLEDNKIIMFNKLTTISAFATKTSVPDIKAEIDNFGFDNFKNAYTEIISVKSSIFDKKFNDFMKNILRLYDRYLVIISIIGRIDNTSSDKTPISGEDPKITTIMKLFEENKTENRESTNDCFQKAIDEYVTPPTTATTTATTATVTKTQIEELTTLIDLVKKNESQDKNELKMLNVGLTKFPDTGESKMPRYEIYIHMDVIEGKLDGTNMSGAKCMYKDKKLTNDFYNIRQKLNGPKWQVTPEQFLNLADIGNKRKPNLIKSTNKAVTKQGGSKTRKKRKYNIRRR